MKRKIKVLHLVSHLDSIGGMETIVAKIAAHLNRDQFETEIWCISKGGRLADELKSQGLSIRVLGINTYHNPLNIIKLAWLFRRAHADIIHTHIYFTSTIGRLAGKLAGVKVLISHVHSMYWHYSFRNLLIERILSKMTRRIICVSDHVKDFVINHEKINPLKVKVVYNGVLRQDGLSRGESRELFAVKDSEIIITIVANLLEGKGHKVLLNALSLVLKQHHDLKCWIVGEGPLDSNLKAYAKQLNIESNVKFWGSRKDVPQILTASDIFVLPSIQREGLSIAAIEAMAYHVPVILSDTGGLSELIDHQKNGLLVASGDVIDLSKAMEELITNPEKRAFFAKEAAKKYEQCFHLKEMILKIEKIYKEEFL